MPRIKKNSQDKSGTAYLEGKGDLAIELENFLLFHYNLQTMSGLPATPNSQSGDIIDLKIERITNHGKFFGRKENIVWMAVISWNVSKPYILSYNLD